jgi:hypothetical protein
MWSIPVVLLIVALALALAGCPTESDGGGFVKTLPPPSVKDLPVYSGDGVADVKTMEEAKDLFGKLSGSTSMVALRGSLVEADAAVFATEFKKQKNETYNAWSSTASAKNSASFSLSFTDEIELNKELETKGASIKGSNSASASTNQQTLLAYQVAYRLSSLENGAKMSGSVKATRTFKIPAVTNYYSRPSYFSISAVDYYIAGTIQTEYASKSTRILKDRDSGNKDSGKYTGSSSYTTKVSAAISFSDGEKRAIFRFSHAYDGSGKSRNFTYGSNSDSSENYSDIEVCNAAGVVLFTIPAYTVQGSRLISSWENLPFSFVYGNNLSSSYIYD